MGSRVTHSTVHNIFKTFIERYMKSRVALSDNDVGAYRIGYIKEYGGWIIEQITNSQGGIDYCFGMKRRNNAEMYDHIQFAMRVMDHIETRHNELLRQVFEGVPFHE